MFCGKNMECPKKFKVPKFKKKVFFGYSWEKMILLPPLLSTNLDKIFFGGTSHHGLPPCKISSKSEHVKCPNFCMKIKNLKKMSPKIVLSWWHCHIRAGMYEPWAKIPLRDCWWCPKKISWPWEHFLGVK